MKRRRRSIGVVRPLLAAAVMAGLAGCGNRPESSGAASGGVAVTSGAWTNFSGARAMEDVKALVSIGPRPSGSERIEKARQHLEKQLKAAGWVTQRQEFTATAPVRGPVAFANVRARLPVGGDDPWQRQVSTLVGSHYDTKWVTDFLFTGANDGGSSTGLLLECARALGAVPQTAAQVELVFLDGEEAFVDFTQPIGFEDRGFDGLFGSRHYASVLRAQPVEQRPKWFVLFDMIGDRELEVEFPPNSSLVLIDQALDAAKALGFGKHFGRGREEMTDDHVPFSWVGLGVIDFIDFNSYRSAGYWHTDKDTLDKLSPESIEIAGRVGLLFIERLVASGSR